MLELSCFQLQNDIEMGLKFEDGIFYFWFHLPEMPQHNMIHADNVLLTKFLPYEGSNVEEIEVDNTVCQLFCPKCRMALL